MSRQSYRWVIVVLLFLVSIGRAHATVADYAFSVVADAYTELSSPTQAIGPSISFPYNDNVAGGPYDIGFTFKFNGTAYTQFTVNTSGMMVLGSSTNLTYYNDLSSSPAYPVLAPLWQQMHTYDGGGCVSPNPGVYYLTSGSAPNRVLTVEWRTQLVSRGTYYWIGCATPMMRFQVKLYESSNKVEFVYGSTWSSTAEPTASSIGIAGAPGDFISVSPGTTVKTSTTTANNSIDLGSTPINVGTKYVFDPCTLSLVGNTAEGGTAAMKDGDDLLVGKQVQRGSSQGFTPFTLKTSTVYACNDVFSYAITGTNAADYALSTTNGSFDGPDQADIPTITFTPQGVGVRTATLTVNFAGQTRSYTLKAEGSPRIKWIGNLAQGGTAAMANGDSLLNGIKVARLYPQDFTPFTLENFNTNQAAPPAPVTYTIDDPTNQYAFVDPTSGDLTMTYSTSLGATKSSTPVVRFSPTGVGLQPAMMTVEADGETRTFVLNAYSSAAGGNFYLGSEKLVSTSQIFQKDFVCAGEYIQTYELTVENVGEGDFKILDVQAYLTDTTYGQGVPAYPLMHDATGDSIRADDYFITDFPGVAPRPANGGDPFPIAVPEKGSRKIYINFVPQKPGKRFARIFIRTNGANLSSTNAHGVQEDGLLTFHLFGRGLGAVPSGSTNSTKAPEPVSFRRTSIGDTTLYTATICNSGGCDLRISRSQFRISEGDIHDFKIVDAFPNASIDQNSDDETWVVPPDSCVTVTFAFMPSRIGSRRATVVLQTNDSTLYTPGLTERGAYYWNLYGVGSGNVVGLTVHDPRFMPGIVDAPTTDQPSGTVGLENQSQELMMVDSMKIVGTDAAEFSMDPANPWPATPFAISPGGILKLAVLYTPAPGSPAGGRSAQLLLFVGSDTVVVQLNGLAGTRTIAVSPSSLFDNTSILVGKSALATVMITNTGSVPLVLSNTTISGPNANDYTLGTIPRLMLAPGQTEFLEVRYRPTSQGQSSATLTIASNATNGAQTVTLGGMGKRIGPGSEAPGAISGVAGSENTEGMNLWQSVPNPARDIVEIRYAIPGTGYVTLRLYDENGRQMKVLDEGTREAGEHLVRVNVGDLPSGSYHYRLESTGGAISKTLQIVK